MCAATGTQPYPGIMCCVITRTLLWDTAHLNELVPLFLKIIHPFISSPLTPIKMIFFPNLIQAKGRKGRRQTKFANIQTKKGQYVKNRNAPGEISEVYDCFLMQWADSLTPTCLCSPAKQTLSGALLVFKFHNAMVFLSSGAKKRVF